MKEVEIAAQKVREINPPHQDNSVETVKYVVGGIYNEDEHLQQSHKTWSISV